MSTIKEVKVALTDADVEAMSRPATRRRVRRRTQEGGQGAPSAADLVKVDPTPSVVQPVVSAPTAMVPDVVTPTNIPNMLNVAPVASVTTVASVASAAPVASVASVAQPISSTVQPPTAAASQPQSGGTTPVQIQTRKRTHGLHAPTPLNTTATRKIVGGAKIVPVKRHHHAASLTLKKKPRLLLGKPSAAPVAPHAHAAPPQQAQPSVLPTHPKRRRRFTERRLSISVKNVSSTRKHRRSITKQVTAMSLEDVRKTLIEKGILKPRSNPPEVMMRSMMADYLSLKSATHA